MEEVWIRIDLCSILKTQSGIDSRTGPVSEHTTEVQYIPDSALTSSCVGTDGG